MQKSNLVNTEPPYGVKVEPRSNNAIATVLSSFAGPKHHQSLDVARHPNKSKPTDRKMRAKDRPLANDSTREPFGEHFRNASRFSGGMYYGIAYRAENEEWCRHQGISLRSTND